MKPKLFEALIANHAEFKEHFEKLKLRSEHPFLKRYAQAGAQHFRKPPRFAK